MRFREKIGFRLHITVAKSVSLLGFSVLSFAVAAFVVPIVSPIAMGFQLFKVLFLFCKGVCGSKEIREEDDFADLDYSPMKSPY